MLKVLKGNAKNMVSLSLLWWHFTIVGTLAAADINIKHNHADNKKGFHQ